MPSLPVRMGLAVRQVDNDLAKAVGRFPAALPATHRAVLQGWEFRLRWADDVLVAYGREEFGRLGPLARHLEVLRAYAEALLALARAGEAQLGDDEKERLTRRALGILPTEEGERFVEIATCPELEPRYLTSEPERFVAGIGEVEKELGQATALGYGSLLMAGVRTPADLMKYGTRIEQLFGSIVSRPAIRGLLEKVRPEGIKGLNHEARLKLLRQVRQALWDERPARLGSVFLLTQVIDGYLGLRPGGVGNGLGLAVIDSIIVSKLGFRVRPLVREGQLYLEIAVSSHGFEYWDPTQRSGTVPYASARRIGLLDLIIMGYEQMAAGYANLSSWANGTRIANWVLGMKPESAIAYEILARCHLGEGRPREALAACQRALEIDQRRAETFLIQGNAFAALERWPEAIASFKQAVQNRVGYAEAFNNLGLALVRNGEPERALGAYREAVRIRPDYADAWFNIGNLHVEQGDYDQAIAAYQKAVAVAPGFAAAYYNLGQAYYAKKELSEALAAYQAAVRVNPKHAGAWHNMGIVYRDLGQTELAVQAIEKAVELNPMLLR